jgi:hypothetical protein
MKGRWEWRDETTERKKGNPIKQGGEKERGDGKGKGDRETEGEKEKERRKRKEEKGKGETNLHQLTT